jgi:predicted nucleic-acid-binding protein
MYKAVLDTNVILRLLIGDNQEQQKQALQWIKQAQLGDLHLTLPTIVVAETVFVLESFYEKQRHDIAGIMNDLLSNLWIDVPDRDVLLALWKYYASGLHFVDSFLIAWSKVQDIPVLSFDKKLLSRL